MDESTNAIEVRNLAKGYKGVPVLHDVSFIVGRGKVYALLGANGSGKTTTINILTTLIKADGGTWQLGDAALLRRTFQDPDIQQWHARRLDSDDEAREWLAEWPRRWEQETDASWAIARTDTDEAVGQVGFRAIRLDQARAQISYWVAPDARGRGAATRAAAAVTSWAMTVVGLQRVGLAHAVSNLASCRVADGARFTYEGTLRRYGLHADGWHDMHMHARIADE